MWYAYQSDQPRVLNCIHYLILLYMISETNDIYAYTKPMYVSFTAVDRSSYHTCVSNPACPQPFDMPMLWTGDKAFGAWWEGRYACFVHMPDSKGKNPNVNYGCIVVQSLSDSILIIIYLV